MKFVDEYRDPDAANEYARLIAQATTRPWTIMEVCGGQTHAIVKHGLDQLLPPEITLLHGPGCPVCVTSAETIDTAIQIALEPDVVMCSFGDMLRVKGSTRDLFSARADGADVRLVYSPEDSLRIAQTEPQKQVVFFAIGFETTAPTTAMTVHRARELGLGNFSMLVAHVLIPPAMELILSSPFAGVQAFLAAGHVCTVTGFTEYERMSSQYSVPIVVTGFEPLDILQGIHMAVCQLENGRAEVENQYTRVVDRAGNTTALKSMRQVFTVCDRDWRGLGRIGHSGLALSEEYASFDAKRRFGIRPVVGASPSECVSGLVLRGTKKPNECPAFGKGCTPEHPLGATMVSSEGACNAYYRYRASEGADTPVQNNRE